MRFLEWLFGKQYIPNSSRDREIREGEMAMRQALHREASARTMLVDSASREKRQTREVIDAAEQAIRAAQWPWEKRNGKASQ
jgi:hypothetical protein